MIKYITIESWFTTKSIQANKPTKWQRLLAYLNLKPLEKPKYWWEVSITIRIPHPLGVGDIILARNLVQYRVMTRLHQNNLGTLETYSITTLEPIEKCVAELGKTVILASAYSEMDPNTQPYGWDRSNWEFSWEQEKISLNEFENRVFKSTIIHKNDK